MPRRLSPGRSSGRLSRSPGRICAANARRFARPCSSRADDRPVARKGRGTAPERRHARDSGWNVAQRWPCREPPVRTPLQAAMNCRLRAAASGRCAAGRRRRCVAAGSPYRLARAAGSPEYHDPRFARTRSALKGVSSASRWGRRTALHGGSRRHPSAAHAAHHPQQVRSGAQRAHRSGRRRVRVRRRRHPCSQS